MIKIVNIEVWGWDAAIRSMYNTHSDSYWTYIENPQTLNTAKFQFFLSEEDLKSMRKLIEQGRTDFLRMINVTCDITAPSYWWNEFNIYNIDTARNIYGTTLKLTEKEFTFDDFSFDNIINEYMEYYNPSTMIQKIIGCLNELRGKYIEADRKLKRVDSTESEREHLLAQRNNYWRQIIKILPSSYNRKHTLQLNYQDLSNIYHSKKNHRLDEWKQFREWCELLPYFTEICVNPFLKEDCENDSN